jgi:methionine synthase I (cobalamin-dependent)
VDIRAGSAIAGLRFAFGLETTRKDQKDMSKFEDFLAQKGALLADGATGTNLFDMGLVSGDAPELWNTDEPQKIKALYKSFVDAGSDIILTNTFGCNRHRLKLHSAQDRVKELNIAAVELAKEVIAAVWPGRSHRWFHRSNGRTVPAARCIVLRRGL